MIVPVAIIITFLVLREIKDIRCDGQREIKDLYLQLQKREGWNNGLDTSLYEMFYDLIKETRK